MHSPPLALLSPDSRQPYENWVFRFKTRVDESLAKLKAATPAQPAKPEAPAK